MRTSNAPLGGSRRGKFDQGGQAGGFEDGPVLPGDSIALLPASDSVDRHGQACASQNVISPDGLDHISMGSHSVMMRDASHTRKCHLHHSVIYASCMSEPAERLKDARLRAGYPTAKAAAEAMGVSTSTYIQHENGVRGFPASKAARYAKFFRVAPEWLLYARGEASPVVVAPELTQLPIIGPIQAGAWLALDDTVQDEPVFGTAAVDRRYPHARQWLREVRGESMNARNVFPGDLVHLVDLAEAGINLNTGMIVEVTRERAGGSLREITLKEVEITPDAIVLWPRSTNPNFKDPVVLDDGSGTDIEVRITGLLLAAIRRFG